MYTVNSLTNGAVEWNEITWKKMILPCTAITPFKYHTFYNGNSLIRKNWPLDMNCPYLVLSLIKNHSLERKLLKRKDKPLEKFASTIPRKPYSLARKSMYKERLAKRQSYKLETPSVANLLSRKETYKKR